MRRVINNLMLLLPVLVLVLASCNPAGTSESKFIAVTDFPNKVESEVSVLRTDSVILAPRKIFIMNNQIWIAQDNKEHIFDVFDINSGKHLFFAGIKGEGPDDFISPMFSTIVADEESFTIHDVNVLKTVRLDSPGVIKIVDSKKTFELFPVNSFVKLNDSLVCALADCALGTTSDYEFRRLNLLTGNESKFSAYPEFLSETKFESEQRCQIFSKYLTSNRNKNKLASFYSYFKFFRLYDFDGELVKEIQVKIEPYTSENVDDWEKRNVYYGPPCATDEYIYAPCGSGEIQVWDWDGNPIMQYSIKQPFFTFAVSETQKKIYMVSTVEDNLDKIFTIDLVHL